MTEMRERRRRRSPERRPSEVLTIEAGAFAGRTGGTLVEKLDHALFLGLCLILLAAPLAFGAVDPVATAVLEIAATLLFLLWCVKAVCSEEVQIQRNPLFLPMACFALAVAMQLSFGLSVYAEATRHEAGVYVAYAFVAFVAAQIFKDEARQRQFMVIFAIYGALLAVFGIIQNLSSNGMIYWVHKQHWPGPFFGPYDNRDHFSGMMEMLAPFALLLALSHRLQAGHRMLAGFAGLVMGVSIFFSASRGGAISFIAQLLFLGAVSFSQKQSKQVRWGIFFTLLCSVIFLFWLGASPILTRWLPSKLHEEATIGRLPVTLDTLKLGAMKPILGWGLGTFPTVYPQYRSFYTDLLVNQAHDDYAQIWMETGIAGTIALLWFLFVMWREALRRIQRGSLWRHQVNVRFAAFTGCVGLMVHSAGDFNLHIPANAMMFYVLCTLACVKSNNSVVREMPMRKSMQMAEHDTQDSDDPPSQPHG